MDLTIFGIDGLQALILTVFVAGFVEMIKALFKEEWQTALIIFIAGVSGSIAGLLIGLPFLTGTVCGFAASGLITVMQNVGNY